MTKKLAGLALAALVLAAPVARAGSKWIYPDVQIDLVNRSAAGALGSARNSADGSQSIFCAIAMTTTMARPSVTCSARNAAGTIVYCYTNATALVDVVKTMNPDGFISFQWDAAGTCTYFNVYTGSAFEPKR